MNVQVWDGVKFTYMPREDAEKLVETGGYQISTGLTSNQLLPHHKLQQQVVAKKPKPKKKKPSKTYNTREMRAEDGTIEPSALPPGMVTKS